MPDFSGNMQAIYIEEEAIAMCQSIGNGKVLS